MLGLNGSKSALQNELSKIMDDYQSIASKGQRLAFAHILVGFALIVAGILDRLQLESYLGYSYFGIWVGIWVRWNVAMQYFSECCTKVIARVFRALR